MSLNSRNKVNNVCAGMASAGRKFSTIWHLKSAVSTFLSGFLYRAIAVVLSILLTGVLLPNFASALGERTRVTSVGNISIAHFDWVPSVADGTDFGNVNVGAVLTRSFTITNLTNKSLRLTKMSLNTWQASNGFSFVGSTTGEMLAGESQTITLQFAPTEGGLAKVQLAFHYEYSNDPGFGLTHRFDIQGNGVAVAAAPEITVYNSFEMIILNGDETPDLAHNTDFGPILVGNDRDVSFYIYNEGTADLDISGPITITGTGADDFFIYGTLTGIVEPNNYYTFLITFAPITPGVHRAIVTIPNNDADEGPFTFVIQGGIGEEKFLEPEIDVSGNGRDIADKSGAPKREDNTEFGEASVASGKVIRTFTIRNSGDGKLNLGTITIGGADAGDFRIVGTIPVFVAPSSTITFDVEFDPSSAGNKSATVIIANNDSNEASFSFAISGVAASTLSSSPQGTITIVQKITGADRSVSFISATSVLNISLTTINGSAQSSDIAVPVGTYVITAPNLSEAGYGISAIYCNDTDSVGDVAARTASIDVSNGENVICTFETTASREYTAGVIGDFLGSRSAMLLNNQPSLGARLGRFNSGNQGQGTASATALGFTASIPSPVDVYVSQNLLSYSASSRAILGVDDVTYPDINKWNIWSEGSVSLFDTNAGQAGSMGVIHIGADYLLNENVLVGLRAQLDWMAQTFAATSGNINGTGWMTGPYATIRLGDNFYFDASATWGTSVNSISPFGTYVDEFTTTRWMINSSLIGEFDFENWTIRPTVGLAYVNEYQNAYVDSLNVAIPGQSVGQGVVSFGPRLSYTSQLGNGLQLVPWVELSGLYNFTLSTAATAGSLSNALSGFTGRVEAGVDVKTIRGAVINLSGQYQGIGSTAQVYGFKLGLSASLN